MVWIEKELEPFIGVKMMNINCAISDCGLWVVNYANMGCFLPVKALFWGWETIKTCVFCTQNVCNVTVRNWNISRLAWPNAMKFFVGGNRHYMFYFMWFLSQSRWCFLRNFPKTVFLRFFIVTGYKNVVLFDRVEYDFGDRSSSQISRWLLFWQHKHIG